MKTFKVEYLDTEHRVYNILVEAEDKDDAIGKAFDEVEDYHGIRDILGIEEQ